jgi:IS30 family transposase
MASQLPRVLPNLSLISQDQLDTVALKLNQRPRKTLDFETPADRLYNVLR